MLFRRRSPPFALRYPPPRIPWTPDYTELHRDFVRAALDDDGVIARFRAGARLPRAYGVGLDERVVEYPWLCAHLPAGGRVLDAGSTLNHAHILDRFLTGVASLHIVTLSPEPISFPERGVSYIFADLRE